MKKYQIIIILTLFTLLFGFIDYELITFEEISKHEKEINNNFNLQIPTSTISPTPTITTKLLFDVPFYPQAPFAEWQDPHFQDACEEAAVMMALSWTKNENLITKEEIRAKILDIEEYEEKSLGEYRDTSAKDSLKTIINEYFGYQYAYLQEIQSIDDIKKQLSYGNLVIVPTNGQTLNNPHFTQPGPERHNLVIKGYDDETFEFITNDPGIREGESYRYPYQTLYDSIRDYLTGYHLPITSIDKTMIIISR